MNGADSHDAALSEVCGHLTRAYCCPVNTNIYVSYGPSEGFGAHWDNHDAIIVPLRGHKRWTIFEPAVLSAERPWTGPEVTDRRLWQGVIEPGMALVIPRGWGHQVYGCDDLSIHCTFAVVRLEVHQLLERIAFEAGCWPSLRADVPFDVHRPARSYAGGVFDQPGGFAAALAEVAGPDAVDRAIASHRARIRRPSFASLAHTVRAVAEGDWTGLRLRLVAPAGVMIIGESDDMTVLAFNDRVVRVHPEATDALVALADATPHAVDDLPPCGRAHTRSRAALAHQLVRSGLAVVEQTPGERPRRSPAT